MRINWCCRSGAAVWISGLALALVASAPEKSAAQARGPIVLHARVREPAATAGGGAPGAFIVKEKILRWDPAQTAIIVCDMWDKHWCQGASRRVAEMAQAMNRAIAAARAKGVLIIHA